MPYLSGVFEQFPELDKISLENLSLWIRTQVDNHHILNILGNRILYPQTVALNQAEMEIDLAILREAVKQKPALVYEPQTNKLHIPELFLQRFPPLARLAGIIIEAINPKGQTLIYIKGKKTKLVGSVISPLEVNKLINDQKKVKIVVDGIEGVLSPGTLSISQISSAQSSIKIGSQDYIVSGGELGVIIDLRLNNK